MCCFSRTCATFFAITYVTLVKTEASLLLRFIPGLLVLFAAYSFLYAGLGARCGLAQETLLAIEFFAEYYGEAFSWFVMLLAVRTLAMAPYRVVGLSFCANAAMTIVFQYMILFNGDAALAIVQMGFFAMLAVLVWALYHFYGISSRYRDALYVGDELGGETGAQSPEESGPPAALKALSGEPPAFVDEVVRLRGMAAEYRLSERETDVFLLLAYGHSRRYICDQLFIADGTASTHISRIYEKMGVSSKQELLSCVRGRPVSKQNDVR